MNFPEWTVPGISSGLLIALIAVIHVFVAQFAVGGGFFLVLAERRALRRGSTVLFDWVGRHSKFFLLVTLVFGSLTGVGIWLIISLVSPAGTTVLIHQFLYAWATEWTFFFGEIIVLILYAAGFSRVRAGTLSPRAHLTMGLFYGIFAFASLVAINGILSFMLTPGRWLETGGFWHGILNPSFAPSTFFRSGLAVMLAGLFGLVTATGIREEETRLDAVRFCATWVCVAFVVMLVSGWWYYNVLPVEVQALMARRTADIRPYFRSLLGAGAVLFLAGLLLFMRLPRRAYLPLVLVVLSLGLGVSGSFEWIRESARRPFVVRDYMYSNGISVEEGQRLAQEGVFARNGWARLVTARNRTFSPEDMKKPLAELLSAEEQTRFARFLYVQQCSNCHGIGGPSLDLLPRLKGRGPDGIAALLTAQGVITPYMPPFFGTEEERTLLVRWLQELVNGTERPQTLSDDPDGRPADSKGGA